MPEDRKVLPARSSLNSGKNQVHWLGAIQMSFLESNLPLLIVQADSVSHSNLRRRDWPVWRNLRTCKNVVALVRV